jgi:regulator of PEP synthase PpsR (kinase-PPPase family)
LVNNNNKKSKSDPIRTVFFISDRTGITAEALGNSLLTQFEGVIFNKVHLSFIDTLQKAEKCVQQINDACIRDGNPALIFSTQIEEQFKKDATAFRHHFSELLFYQCTKNKSRITVSYTSVIYLLYTLFSFL